MIFSIIGFTAGLILFSIAMFKFGKKSYIVKLDIDVKEIIDKSVKEFMQEHSKQECNHKWEIISNYSLESNGNVTSKIILQKCVKCGELKETRIKA